MRTFNELEMKYIQKFFEIAFVGSSELQQQLSQVIVISEQGTLKLQTSCKKAYPFNTTIPIMMQCYQNKVVVAEATLRLNQEGFVCELALHSPNYIEINWDSFDEIHYTYINSAILSARKIKRPFNKREQTWLNNLLATTFIGKEIVEKQLAKAIVTAEVYGPYTSLILETTCEEYYPHPFRVPVVMVAYQPNGVPIEFLLHIVDGFVDELEIYWADGEMLSQTEIELDKVVYDTKH